MQLSFKKKKAKIYLIKRDKKIHISTIKEGLELKIPFLNLLL